MELPPNPLYGSIRSVSLANLLTLVTARTMRMKREFSLLQTHRVAAREPTSEPSTLSILPTER